MSETDVPLREVQTAVVQFRGGPLDFRAEVRVTPRGILSLGALLGGVLLSTAVIVWTSTSAARRRATAGAVTPRRGP